MKDKNIIQHGCESNYRESERTEGMPGIASADMTALIMADATTSAAYAPIAETSAGISPVAIQKMVSPSSIV